MQVLIEHVPHAGADTVREIPVVSLIGRLDAASAPEVDAALTPLLSTPRRQLVVYLAGVTYISSAGLRSILRLIKHTHAAGGRLAVFGPAPHILEVIEISGFPALLDVFPDRASALNGSPA